MKIDRKMLPVTFLPARRIFFSEAESTETLLTIRLLKLSVRFGEISGRSEQNLSKIQYKTILTDIDDCLRVTNLEERR